LEAAWKHVLEPALSAMGIWGVFLVATFDSAAVPLPIDPFLAFYIWGDKRHFWIYVLLAAAGSALGGLSPYWVGRAGGEIFLLKRIDRARLEKLRARFIRQSFLAILIPSILPPPTPWKIFVFAAGVFKMRVPLFLLAAFCGRLVRWFALAILIIKLGPSAVVLVAHHSLVTIVVVASLVQIGILCWWLVKKHGTRRTKTPSRAR
jgi:membrane protein YqaA with SNARE-associated domain